MKIKTGYQSYDEMMLDFDIFGQLVSEPQIPTEEYKELLYSDYKKTHLVTLEDKRYSFGGLADTSSSIEYSQELVMGIDDDEIDLLSEDDDEFSEDIYSEAESYLSTPSNEEISQFLAERQAMLQNVENSDGEGSLISEEDDSDVLQPADSELLNQSEELFGTVEQGSNIVYEDLVDSQEEEEFAGEDFELEPEPEDDGWDDEPESEDEFEPEPESEDEFEPEADDEFEPEPESEDEFEPESEEFEPEESLDSDDGFDNSSIEEVQTVVESEPEPIVSAFVTNSISEGQIPESVPPPAILLNSATKNSTGASESLSHKPKKKKKNPVDAVSKPDAPKKKSKPKKPVTVQEPTDLREFLRKYPHAELTFVLQHFSRKEVQRALALGIVIKKGNKLHI